MLLHLSPQAELQSHLCDWCCLWTTFFPTSCLAFPRLVAPPAQRSRGAGAPLRWCDRISLSSPFAIILQPVQRVNANQYAHLLKSSKSYRLFCTVVHDEVIFWLWILRLPLQHEKEQFLQVRSWKTKARDVQCDPGLHPETLDCSSCKLKNIQPFLGSVVCMLGQGTCRVPIPVTQVPPGQWSSSAQSV